MVNVRRRKLKWILFIAFLIAPVTPVRPGEPGLMRISLFFASPDGSGLVRETAEIDSCGSDLADCIQDAVKKLAGGPLGELAPTLPSTTVINDVQVRDDTAYLDFGNELADGLPGGSSAEMTAVYSIVDTISFNFPQIKKVKFLLDGHEVETLKGHIDLRSPIIPDFSLEKDKNANTAQKQQ